MPPPSFLMKCERIYLMKMKNYLSLVICVFVYGEGDILGQPSQTSIKYGELIVTRRKLDGGMAEMGEGE